MSRWNGAQAIVAGLFVLAVAGTCVIAASSAGAPPERVRDAVYRRYLPPSDPAPGSSVNPSTLLPADASGLMAKTPAQLARQQEGEGLSQSLRSHRVRLSNDGYLVGRLGVIDPDTGRTITASAISINFVQQGSIIKEVKPGVDGIFQAKLDPGVYSMIAAGLDGFMAFGTQILPWNDNRVGLSDRPGQSGGGAVQLVNFFQEELSGLQIDGAMIPPRNFPVLRQLVQLYLPAVGEQALPQQGSEAPPAKKAEEGTPPEDAGPAEPQSETPSTVLHNHAVQLRSDGRLVGRMRRIHPQSGRPIRVRRLNIFFIRDGELVAQAPVNENGEFEVKGLRTGVHSMVAAGVEGFAAFAVLIAAPGDNMTSALEQSGPFKNVSAIRMVNNNNQEFILDVSLLSPEDFAVLVDVINQFLGGAGLGGIGIGAGFAGLLELPQGLTPNTLGEMLAATGATAATIGAITGAIVSNNQSSNAPQTSFDPFQQTSFQGLNQN